MALLSCKYASSFLMFGFGATMLLQQAIYGEEVQANDSNRAFSVPSPMGFSTSSPSATTGGGQSNTPVCTRIVLHSRILSLHFHIFLFRVLICVSLVIHHFAPIISYRCALRLPDVLGQCHRKFQPHPFLSSQSQPR